MVITIIGVGLIGGSMALDLKQRGFTDRVIGVARSAQNAKDAIDLGIVDEIMVLEEALPLSDLVIVAIPVKACLELLPFVLDHIKANAVVTDVGSTKKDIELSIRNHPKRKQFVAAHPIAGTENSGAKAAIHNLFDNKIAILCDLNQSTEAAVAMVLKMYEVLNMKILYMESEAHDMHVAYVSHISHITSFVLAQTVLEIEKSTSTIFNLAGSGFASTVRLAKSSPAMWAPIFDQNATYISEALDAYIKNLIVFKQNIDQKNTEALYETMLQANGIRKVLEGIKAV
jgi:prephenate dehydrogenase